MPPLIAVLATYIAATGISYTVAEVIAYVVVSVATSEAINAATQALSPRKKSGANQQLEVNYFDTEASLIAIFDGSAVFTSAEFRAPLTEAQIPGQEHFDLAVKIREGAR